jgi:hypothetical protein
LIGCPPVLPATSPSPSCGSSRPFSRRCPARTQTRCGPQPRRFTQWLVRRASDSAVEFDSGEDPANKTTCAVPAGRLMNATNYIWQVRYKDNHGLWSDYSPQTSLTTIPPTLAAQIQGNRVVFTWSTNAAGFSLVCSSNLSAGSLWSAASTEPVIINGQNVVSNAPSGPRMFYRLKK